MTKEMIISSSAHETRVAILEEDLVAEIFIERERSRGVAGNLYKGRVSKVLPGMQSAFVDLGLERDAFLYVSDVIEDLEEYESETPDELHIDRAADDLQQPRAEASIADLLREGQEIVVQVSKDTIAGKGARITSHVTLPGRFLVYMPTVNHVGVSRRIEDETERVRLKEMLERIRPNSHGGFIVRTAGEGRDEAEFAADLKYLTDLCAHIRRRADQPTGPAAVHHALDLRLRPLRAVLSAAFKSG